MSPLEFLSNVRAIHWIAVAACILLIDYATGPFIQFPILFVIPVALGTATHGRRVGYALAVLLPLIRLSFFLEWALPSTWTLELIDTLVDVIILAGFAALINQVVRQQRNIRILEGMLPICGFCKRIRDEDGSWKQIESFITERSSAQFSHTFCVECGRKHYPELAE